MNKLKSLFLHYVYGLLSQCFNGAMTAATATIINMTGPTPPTIDAKLLLHNFLAGLAIAALLYFRENPLPKELPPGIADEETTTATATLTTTTTSSATTNPPSP